MSFQYGIGPYISGSIFSNTGQLLNYPSISNCQNTGNYGPAIVGFNDNGFFSMVPASNEICGQTFRNGISTSFLVNATFGGLGQPGLPMAACLQNNNFFVTWTTNYQFYSAVSYSVINAVGNILYGPVQLEDYTDNSQVAMLDSGAVVLVYETSVFPGIFGRVYNPNGQPMAKPFPIGLAEN
eukprot:TRINITY_DN20018_c0_g1_i1.p1 TRINITY_DN20018_c0_g1~~TRINITY_DN20018_c0_g1_i1.p1  ORF type:complete len:201 (-),score=23.20 TRINITY_DN20018_c0_g1_i1:17-562(-)